MKDLDYVKIHEIKEANKLVAIFMGAKILSTEEIIKIGYPDRVFLKHEWSMPEGLPIFAWENAMEGKFNYNRSWDCLMPVIRKINGMGKEYQFTIFKTYVSCTVEKGGKFYKDFSFSHAEYITEEQSDIEAAFKLVIRFIEWYNQINNEINNENQNKT